jgi:N-acetyl-beta-hexosaminidase
VQGNVWTEYMKTPAYVQYMVWPRATALAEVGWTSKGGRNFEDFSKRLETHKKRLDFLGVNYFGAPTNDKSNTLWPRKSKRIGLNISKSILKRVLLLFNEYADIYSSYILGYESEEANNYHL